MDWIRLAADRNYLEAGNNEMYQLDATIVIYYHNCSIKLVHLIIFIYDARSHKHQT
jgi:hypothetical protein